MKLRLLILLIFFIQDNTFAQKPSILNVRINIMEEGKVRINYDVENLNENDSVGFYVVNKNGATLVPKSFIGDFGKKVTPGKNKLIIWDLVKDEIFVDEEFQIQIKVKLSPREIIPPEPKNVILGGGVSNTLLSVVAPGLGNIFVTENHKIGLRPLITATYVGLLIYGFTMKSKKDEQYAIYESKLRSSEAAPYYDLANYYHHRYYAATRLAGVIWAFDIITTFIKGSKNDKIRKNTKTSFNLNSVGETPTLGFKYNF